ncbi:uncharacterized protein LOC143193827 isoform X2 [Rhynchophorus ferrugineus]|uniref:Mediator of RNA polymerase II transcription subunit 26 n=1 Tax=Rhynchophorus ferrugineus TaxID=354439 RepID=A0A834INK4_RHYFE|nr:hypothetical protein GWI33_001237 [Rhynchophorus ferrugineus]
MQNNVTELTQRLLRALDSNYNVINIQEVVEVISLLEKVAITKELLQTTRLGKYVNELRRKTSNADLSRRAKVLVKKWRSLVIPEENGQVKSSPPLQQQVLKVPAKNTSPLHGQAKVSRTSPVPSAKGSPPPVGQRVSPGLPGHKMVSPGLQGHRLASIQKMVSPSFQKVSPKLGTPLHNPKLETSPPLVAGQSADVNLNQLKNKKRPAKGILDTVQPKRARLNGGVTDFDFSDNSNSSFKDVILPAAAKAEHKSDVILINSDSNSSFSEKTADPSNDQQQPKKRGRKKGSKNHKNLLDEAETSFTNKLAVSASRGSSKVKTTQELLASIQNKNSVLNSTLKPREDLEEKAAKLTERVSIIDQKLNANAHRNKNSQKNKFSLSTNSRNERVIESGSVINDKNLLKRMREEEEEIVVVDDVEPESDSNADNKSEIKETEPAFQENVVKSLSVEEAMALLPPIDKSVLLEDPDVNDPLCSCYLKENKPDFSIDDEDVEQPPPFEIVEDPACSARIHLSKKYNAFDTSAHKIRQLHVTNVENVNGNASLGTPRPPSQIVDGLYLNIVPNIYEELDKDVRPLSCETFKKYSVSKGLESESCGGDGVGDSEPTEQQTESNRSESSDNRTGEVFREWYECLDRPSYNGETLRILPYCIVD